jgi:histidinol-phosphate aminotransferase
VKQAERDAVEVAEQRAELERALTELGVDVAPGSQAPYLLCRITGRPEVRERLRELGVAVRRGDTFPGLDPEHWRTAVRGPEETAALISALRQVL